MNQIGDPITRFENFLVGRKIITKELQETLRKEALNDCRDALKSAVNTKMPSIDGLFEDVYENLPQHLQDQRDQLKEHLRKYPNQYNLDQFEDGTSWPLK